MGNEQSQVEGGAPGADPTQDEEYLEDEDDSGEIPPLDATNCAPESTGMFEYGAAILMGICTFLSINRAIL